MTDKIEKRLTKEEAEKYTESAANIQLGGWQQIALGMELGAPEALDLSQRDWVAQVGGPARLSLEDRRWAVHEMTEKGLDRKQIGAVLDISEGTVTEDRTAKRGDAKDAKPVKSEKRGDAKDDRNSRRRKVIELDEQGLNQAEIAGQLGVGRSTVRDDLKWHRDRHPLAKQAEKDQAESGVSKEEVQAAEDEQRREKEMRDRQSALELIYRIETPAIDAAQRVRAYGLDKAEPRDLERYAESLKRSREAIDQIAAAIAESINEARLEL